MLHAIYIPMQNSVVSCFQATMKIMMTQTTICVALVLAVSLVSIEGDWTAHEYSRGQRNGKPVQEYNYGKSSECPELNDVGIIVCEGGVVSIYCQPPSTLLISEAIYGRTENASVCPYITPPLTTNCQSTVTDGIIKGACNGQQSCGGPVTNEALGGDPCPGTFKYINVKYRCV